ncbi:MAG TPA: M14 family zinc carboxypeptidase [Pirellulales bacterium]|nr:M14 family zinc carboxypeptidase [Pirellulales bacterium]
MQWLKQRRLAYASWMILGMWCSLAAAQMPMRPEESLFAAPDDQAVRSSPMGADDSPLAEAERPRPLDEREHLSAEGGWQVLTRSVEQRVIEYRQFGRGEAHILVVGPLEGDESAGVELLERLVDHLERFPRRLQGATVTVVRDPNPDGRLRGSRTNARGVRLDMNFPTRQWRKVPIADHWLSGRTPESEPETRALIELLDDLKPDRLVLLEATRHEAELRYSQSAEPMARRLARESQLAAIAWDSAESPASLATYAGNHRGLPTLVLRIRAAAGAEYNWVQHKRALLSAVDGDAAEPAAAPAHRLASLTRASGEANPPTATEQSSSEVSPPRGVVLAAKELELGGVLAPVVVPSRRPPLPARRLSTAPPRQATGKPSASKPQRWMVPYRGPASGGLSNQRMPGVPGKPVPYGAANRFSPPSAARTTQRPTPATPRVERLPPVAPNSPAQRPLPQPIPLYPETGY